MGFLDKAKKLAEQAQTKLDEAQKQFNQGQSGSTAPPRGPAVEYDQHGRPIPSEEPASTTPPHGDPLAGEAAVAPAPPPVPGAAAPVPDPAAPDKPAGPAESEVEEDRNHPSYAPPKLSGGDPLAP
jgi:hypothetical protein